VLRPYETTFVIDSLLRAEEVDETIRRYLKFISDNGGEIRRVERWGKRRLAYEIRKRQYGYYVYVRFDGPPTIVAALEREYRLDENILRYLTIHLSKRALEKERYLIEQGIIKETKEPLEPSGTKPAAEARKPKPTPAAGPTPARETAGTEEAPKSSQEPEATEETPSAQTASEDEKGEEEKQDS